jgi:predicted GNAT family N-acyltransferase
MEITTGSWDIMKEEARQIRCKVFVEEQNVPVEIEWDDFDAGALHALARDDSGRAVATGRLLPDKRIGRMAVLKEARGSGIGSKVLSALIDAARSRGDSFVTIHAQLHAKPFYEKFGFVPFGNEFLEADIPHVEMRLSL